MWDVVLPVFGRCPDCGQDLSGDVRVHATADWIARYHADSRHSWGVNRAVERHIMERHTRRCAARQQQRAAYAVSA